MTSRSHTTDHETPWKTRPASLFDAVAGRVGYEGFLTEQPQPSVYRDTASASLTAIPADEVLFRRKGAPARYQEDDVYAADRQLRDREVLLPESELVKAIHAYVADFYGAMGSEQLDFRSMDETALLAMGMLLEEAAAESLGRTGDLAFVEGSADDPLREGTGDAPVFLHEGQVRSCVVDQPPRGRKRKSPGRSDAIPNVRVAIRSRSGKGK